MNTDMLKRAMTIVTGKAYGVMKVTLGYMVMEMHNGRH